MSAHINIVFRATFQGPKGPILNKGGFAASGVQCELEVYLASRASQKWLVRFVGQKKPTAIPWQPNADSARTQVSQRFDQRLSEWQMGETFDGENFHPIQESEVYQSQLNGLYYRFDAKKAKA
jgi:hypothetical protein